MQISTTQKKDKARTRRGMIGMTTRRKVKLGQVRRYKEGQEVEDDWDAEAGWVTLLAAMVQEAVMDAARGVRHGWLDGETLEARGHVMTGAGFGVRYVDYILAMEASRFLRDERWCASVLDVLRDATGKKFTPAFFRSRVRRMVARAMERGAA